MANATPKEPAKKQAARPGSGILEQLLQMARNMGWVIIPAAAAPYPLNTYINPGKVADSIIVVEQNKPQSVDYAEDLATTLGGEGGSFETHEYKGDLQRMSYPVLVVYL